MFLSDQLGSLAGYRAAVDPLGSSGVVATVRHFVLRTRRPVHQLLVGLHDQDDQQPGLLHPAAGVGLHPAGAAHLRLLHHHPFQRHFAQPRHGRPDDELAEECLPQTPPPDRDPNGPDHRHVDPALPAGLDPVRRHHFHRPVRTRRDPDPMGHRFPGLFRQERHRHGSHRVRTVQSAVPLVTETVFGQRNSERSR